MPSADGPGVSYRRRAVNSQCGMYQAGARSGSARDVGGCTAHSKRKGGGRRSGRGRDTTTVIRLVCVTIVTVYPALILVMPLGLM